MRNKKTVDEHDDAGESSENAVGDKETSSKKQVSLGNLFRYADAWDWILMVCGILLAMAQGAGIPLALFFFYKEILNAMIFHSSCMKDKRDLLLGNRSSLTPEQLQFMNSSEFKKIKDSYNVDPDKTLFEVVGPLCGYYALVGLGMFLCGSVHIACWTAACQRQIERIRNTLFKAMLSKEAGWFDARRAGALNNVIFDNIRKMEDGMGSKISIAISWLSVCLVGFIMAFVTDWLVTIVICSLVPLLFIVSFVMIRIVRVYSSKQTDAYSTAGAIASEVLSNARTVIAFNRQEYEVERYGKHLGESTKMGTIKTVTSGVGQGLIFLIINAMAGLAFWYSTEPDVVAGGGDIMQIIICVMVGTTSLANAAPNFQNIAGALAGATDVYSVIDEKSKIDNFSEEGLRPKSINGDITFESVGFSYPSRPDKQILNSLDLNLKQGQTIALVGPSGCGKSTCAQMLMRFYDATSGKVTIDGVDIRELNVRWLRQHVAMVSQEPILFNATIRENIVLGMFDKRLEATEDQMIAACKLSNAHEFISVLPRGYDTHVGEKGAQLSGGQKQRIAIARALISNPKILLLDEATSALDTSSEKVVQEALDNARVGRTTLVIAHRLSTIRNADLIAAIDKGAVVELGTHSELMEQGGLYYKLVRTQEVEDEHKNLQKQLIDGSKKEEEAAEEEDTTTAVRRISGPKGDGQQDAVENGDVEAQVTKKKKKPSRRKLMRTVLGWGRPELKYTVVCVFVSAIAAAVQPAFAIVLAEFLGGFCHDNDTQSEFTMLIGVMMALGVIQTVSLGLQHYLFAVIGGRLTERMRCRLLGKILRMNAGWLDRQENQPSVLTTILATDCIDVQGMSGVRICIIVTVLVTVSIAVIYSLVIEWRLALALLGLMPFIIVSSIFYGKMIMGADKEDDETSDSSQAIVTMDAVSNMRTVMALTAEPYFMGRFSKEFVEVKRTGIKIGLIAGPLLSFTMSSILWAGAITFCLGSWLMQNDPEEVSFKEVIQVYILITFSGMSIGRSTTAVPDENKATKATEKLSAILGVKITIDKEDSKTFESIGAREIRENPSLLDTRGTGRIEFRNVSFSYPTRATVPVLRGVNFTVEPGQSVALCGPSGGGKSTVMQLVQRLYDPNEGKVSIDGVNICDANIRVLRSNIGLVSQEPSLFGLSIQENIEYGSKSPEQLPDGKEIDSVCKQANIVEFLPRLSDGLQTQVGERGSQLSGGQKQRVAIARALVRNPVVLLLDEATSALDTASEKVVQDALDAASEGRTSLTIAHRLSTIQNCDKILVLANGTVAEEGTHAELLDLKGLYFGLHSAQNKVTEADNTDPD